MLFSCPHTALSADLSLDQVEMKSEELSNAKSTYFLTPSLPNLTKDLEMAV